MDIHERFEAVNDDYINFDRVENKRSERPDLHAWLLLDELFPNPGQCGHNRRSVFTALLCGVFGVERWTFKDCGT